MAAQTVAVTLVVSMIVTVAVPVVRTGARFLGLFWHSLDSNRDLVRLTARIRGASADNDVVDRNGCWERTHRPKRN